MGNGSSTKNKNGVLKETMADHEESINCMALSEDGSMLVTGSEDSTARMWSTKTEETECIGVLRYHKSRISNLTNPFTIHSYYLFIYCKFRIFQRTLKLYQLRRRL